MPELKISTMVYLVIFAAIILPVLYFFDRRQRRIQKASLHEKLLGSTLRRP